jgi:tetratricopeptide (TPR) repeat protein
VQRALRFLGARPRRTLFLCTALAYAAALVGPFQFDDQGVIVRYAPVHSLGGWWAALGHGIRPLLKLTYAANWALGAGAAGFHLFNLAVHLANVDLVLRLAAATHPEERWPFRTVDPAGLTTGLLFALHPIQTEAVTYVSGRSASLMTTFVLLALLLYAEGVRGRRAWLWAGLAPAAFLGALLTKEMAVTLPAGVLLWDLCFEDGRPARRLLRAGLWGALLLGLAAAAVMHGPYFTLLYDSVGARPLLAAIRYQLEGTGYLLGRLLLVHRLSIDPGLGQQQPGAAAVAVSALVVGGMLALALAQRRRRPAVCFGLLWFLLQVFVPYVLLQRTDVVNERHMYLASFGLFLAAGAWWGELMTRPGFTRWAPRLAVVAAVALMAGTTARNLDYRSELALWESTARVSPENPRAHHNLGVVYESAGRAAEARDAYARALALEPRYRAARTSLERVQRDLAAGADSH